MAMVNSYVRLPEGIVCISMIVKNVFAYGGRNVQGVSCDESKGSQVHESRKMSFWIVVWSKDKMRVRMIWGWIKPEIQFSVDLDRMNINKAFWYLSTYQGSRRWRSERSHPWFSSASSSLKLKMISQRMVWTMAFLLKSTPVIRHGVLENWPLESTMVLARNFHSVRAFSSQPWLMKPEGNG